MGERIYLAYFEAVTTNTPDCIEQHKHAPPNRTFTKRENDFFALDDKALKTALLNNEEPRSCVFLGIFEEEQVDSLERFLVGEIDSFNFPHGWYRVNFNRKYARLLSETIVSLPLDDSPHMRRPFFCIVRHSEIQDSVIRGRFFRKLESKASLLSKDEMFGDDPLPEAARELHQSKTFESWFCHSCDFYALKKDSCDEITDMQLCNVEHWTYLRDNYRNFFLKFLELAENLRLNPKASEVDGEVKSDQSKAKSSKNVASVSKDIKISALIPDDKSVSKEDKRTPTMRRIQQEAEAIPLPDNDDSNDQWITSSNLARRIANEKGKTRSSRNEREKTIKERHKTARETLDSERKIGKCIWPQDKETAKQNPLCGWAKHERFWRKKKGQPHPVFYYRLTIEKGWQEKETERQEDIEPNNEPS